MLLKDFRGVLVSDFYAAYEAIPCPQQKCLIHLIRDLNEDVLKYPYDEELKRIGLAFAVLLKGMVETVDRFGLQESLLAKAPFGRGSILSTDREVCPCKAEIADKSSKESIREKNRDKLFTFLKFADGVPWNNNNAEHGVKPFAALRQIIGGITSENGIRDYLSLLSIRETCKYMGLDFLDFVLVGGKGHSPPSGIVGVQPSSKDIVRGVSRRSTLWFPSLRISPKAHDLISDLQLPDRTFPGGRTTKSGKHHNWDKLFIRVKPADKDQK